MKPSRRRSLWIILALAAVLAVPTVVAVRVFNQGSRAAKQSAQLAAFDEIKQELNDHYREHGRYPVVLEELHLTYPDGGDSALLKEFRYVTDGKTYSLEVTGAYTQKVYRFPKPANG
jgi:type II secretory pathway pseudopilin PulG